MRRTTRSAKDLVPVALERSPLRGGEDAGVVLAPSVRSEATGAWRNREGAALRSAPLAGAHADATVQGGGGLAEAARALLASRARVAFVLLLDTRSGVSRRVAERAG